MLDTWSVLKQQYGDAHGSPLDRGSADSYYDRSPDPHWYPEGTYNGERITPLNGMTVEQIEAYYAGYEYNENFGDKKDWG